MNVKRLAVALFATTCLTSPALAQSSAAKPGSAPISATTTPGAPAVADTVAVPVWPKVAVELPENPVPASFALGRIEGVPAELLTGVTAKGYARKVAVENQTVGQVLVVSVAKGDREETISAEGLTAQFDAKETSSLFPEKTVEVNGSKSALVAALERLAAPKAAEKEKTATKDEVSQNPVSSGGSKNNEAAAYRSPTIAASTPEEKAPVTDTRTTRDGCPVRIDLAQGTAFQQNKVQTFTDGKLTNDGQCTDGGASYPLKKSYSACPTDTVDQVAMKAWPQFQWYYIDDASLNHPVGECQKDTDSIYTIVEDESRCPIDLDFKGGKATPQAALVYTNRNNAPVQVRGCQASTKASSYTMSESTSGCPVRIDAAGTKFVQSQWVYWRDGVLQQATQCADTGRSTIMAACPVRIDTVQGKVVVQTKEQTIDKGVMISETACADTATSYTLKKSYSVCPTDIVDLAGMKAWPQFQFFYIDGNGDNRSLGECVKDEETAYTITEDESQCRIDIDFLNKQAVPQSALTYIGRNNALTQVPGRGCGPSTKSPAVPLTENKAACPMRPDFVAGLSYELSTWTYLLAGVTYQAAPCADTGRTFPHATIYADAGGNYICPVITNLSTTPKSVTLQSRKQIVVDGIPQYITECTPDTASKAVLPTTDGCMDPSKWVHDLDANMSYGQERFYWIKADGSREYVTQCQTSTKTYPHDITITGYQNHDNQLWAYPLTTVTILVGGTPYTIVSSEVLAGAPQLPYVLEGAVDQPTGNSNYDGCNAYRETAKYERWTRPDGSEYLKPIGAGTPVGPVNVCVSTVVGTQPVLMQHFYRKYSSIFEYGCEGMSCNVDTIYNVTDLYKNITKVNMKNYETGEVISSSCQIVTNSESFPANYGQCIYTMSIYWSGYCPSVETVVPEPLTSCPF